MTGNSGNPEARRAAARFNIVSRPVLSAAVALILIAGGTFATDASSVATTSAPTDFAKIVQVNGRGVYIQCEGTGSPTVMLISGAGVSAESWDYVGDTADAANPPVKSPAAVEPQLARVTRVCSYDRPGRPGSTTRRRVRARSRSQPPRKATPATSMPRSEPLAWRRPTSWLPIRGEVS
jgi:hypothetical protein